MIQIPQANKKFQQTNKSDVSGNIWYTKNINFDEEGYIKLSSRAASIACVEDYSNFSYPLSLGRYNLTGGAYIVPGNTDDHVFDVDLSLGGLAVNGNNTTGGNRPSGAQTNRGKWWQNKWHVVGLEVSNLLNTGLFTDTLGTWAKVLSNVFTLGYPHPLEVFRSRTTLCVGDANIVRQYTPAYVACSSATSPAGAQLTLPADYTVIDLAYNGDMMGIATQTANTLPGQNQEAMFYTWDGLQTSANKGYPVGSDAVIQVKAYKSSWVLLTRNGKVLYFNGDGFTELTTLPFFFKKLNVDVGSMFGDIMTVSGDLIFFNIPADITYFGLKQERFMQNFNGGVLCYDPAVGLYHRYSPSISKLYQIAVSSVDTTADILTGSGTIPATGNPILYSNDPANPIGGLSLGVVYYLIRHNTTTFSLARTYADAIAGNKIDLTSNHSGTFLALALTDYGSSKATATNAIMTMGSQSYNYDHLMFGGYYENVSGVPKQNLCLTIPQFANRGYFVTPKIESKQIEDNMIELYLKYKPLRSTDSIIIKHKKKDHIGIPVTTPQRGLICTWTSSLTLTTTADISEIFTYLSNPINSAECEIISGAGAGQMPQIASIALNAGTYTITLSEVVDGVVNGNSCNVIIDNWRVCATITSSDSENWKQISVAKVSKWHKFKIELRGVEVTIEQLIANNKVQTPIV